MTKVQPCVVLQEWRERNGLTQTALAKLIGVTKAQVSRWESGDRPVTADQACAIERTTGLSRERLRPDLFGPISPERAEALRHAIG